MVDNDACIKFSLFSNTNVSQGSSATHVRCGGIVNDDFDAYLLVNLSVKKKFKNRSTFCEVMDNIVVPCFFDSQCTCSTAVVYETSYASLIDRGLITGADY